MLMRVLSIIAATIVSVLSSETNTSTLAPGYSTTIKQSSSHWTKTDILTTVGIVVAVIVGLVGLPASILAVIELRKRYKSRKSSNQAGEPTVTDRSLDRHLRRSPGEDVIDGESEPSEETPLAPLPATVSNPVNHLRISSIPQKEEDNIDGISENRKMDWKKAKPDPLKHFSDVEKKLPVKFNRYFTNLGYVEKDIGKIVEGCDQPINFETAAFEVFTGWRQREANKASLKALLGAFTTCKFNDQSAALKEQWDNTKRSYDEKIKDQDIYPIIDEFTPAELRKLFCDGLKIKKRDVEIHMGTAADSREKVMRLLNDWQMKNPDGTLEDLLNAFGNNNEVKQELSKEWSGDAE